MAKHVENIRRTPPLKKTVIKLKTTGRKNRYMGASTRGRQHGGGFTKNQV